MTAWSEEAETHREERAARRERALAESRKHARNRDQALKWLREAHPEEYVALLARARIEDTT